MFSSTNLMKLRTLVQPLSQPVGLFRTLCSATLTRRPYSSSKTSQEQEQGAKKSSSSEGSSSLKDKLPSEAVFYHPQHDMYVCWHPEVPFPYEMSKPIPTDAPMTESALKIQALEPVKEIFRKKSERLIVRELMQLTYTPKYGWRGKHLGKKMKYVRMAQNPLKQKRNREYL